MADALDHASAIAARYDHHALAELLEDLTGYRARVRGREYVITCPNPEHVDEHPSCSVYWHEVKAKAYFRCRACGVAGDAINAYELVGGCDRKDAMRRARRRAAALPPKRPAPPRPRADPDKAMPLLLAAARHFRENLGEESTLPARAARSYLAERGVTPEQIERYGIGVTMGPNRLVRLLSADLDTAQALGLVTRPQPDGKRTDSVWSTLRVVLPCVYAPERLVDFVGRTTPHSGRGERYVQTCSPWPAPCFGVHQARRKLAMTDAPLRVAIAEGPFDALALDRIGVAALAINGNVDHGDMRAARARALQIDAAIAVVAGRVPGAEGWQPEVELVLAFDADPAGSRGTRTLGQAFADLGYRVQVASLPTADPADVSPRVLADAMREAQSYADWARAREAARAPRGYAEGSAVAGL